MDTFRMLFGSHCNYLSQVVRLSHIWSEFQLQTDEINWSCPLQSTAQCSPSLCGIFLWISIGIILVWARFVSPFLPHTCHGQNRLIVVAIVFVVIVKIAIALVPLLRWSFTTRPKWIWPNQVDKRRRREMPFRGDWHTERDRQKDRQTDRKTDRQKKQRADRSTFTTLRLANFTMWLQKILGQKMLLDSWIGFVLLLVLALSWRRSWSLHHLAKMHWDHRLARILCYRKVIFIKTFFWLIPLCTLTTLSLSIILSLFSSIRHLDATTTDLIFPALLANFKTKN